MSSMPTLITVAVGFAGSIGSSVAAFVRQAKNFETQVQTMLVQVTDDVDTILEEIDKISKDVTKAISALQKPEPMSLTIPVASDGTPAKKAVKKTATKKAAPAAKTRQVK
jgi:hypothetical protein